MIWHNEEAGKLAQQIQKILVAWNQGAICPSEFLFQLESTVTHARNAKTIASKSTPSPNP